MDGDDHKPAKFYLFDGIRLVPCPVVSRAAAEVHAQVLADELSRPVDLMGLVHLTRHKPTAG